MFRRVCPCPFEWLWGRFGVPFGVTFGYRGDPKSRFERQGGYPESITKKTLKMQPISQFGLGCVGP